MVYSGTSNSKITVSVSEDMCDVFSPSDLPSDDSNSIFASESFINSGFETVAVTDTRVAVAGVGVVITSVSSVVNTTVSVSVSFDEKAIVEADNSEMQRKSDTIFFIVVLQFCVL